MALFVRSSGDALAVELHQGALDPLVPAGGERGGRHKDGGQAAVCEL